MDQDIPQLPVAQPRDTAPWNLQPRAQMTTVAVLLKCFVGRSHSYNPRSLLRVSLNALRFPINAEACAAQERYYFINASLTW